MSDNSQMYKIFVLQSSVAKETTNIHISDAGDVNIGNSEQYNFMVKFFFKKIIVKFCLFFVGTFISQDVYTEKKINMRFDLKSKTTVGHKCRAYVYYNTWDRRQTEV